MEKIIGVFLLISILTGISFLIVGIVRYSYQEDERRGCIEHTVWYSDTITCPKQSPIVEVFHHDSFTIVKCCQRY